MKPNLYPTRYPDLFRLKIGEQIYLISKNGISLRKEIICQKDYSRVKMENSVALHLNFRETFMVQDKMLEVEAIAKTTYGPLGDRLILNAWYDHQKIGDFSALKSYMGGGMNGKWPFIRTENGNILFTFSTNGMFGNTNELIIEHFQTIVPDDTELQLINRPICRSLSEVPTEYLEDDFTLEQIDDHKKISWLLPLRDTNNKINGTIICFYYAGFERFKKVYYGKLDPTKFHQKTYISRSSSESGFYALKIEYNESIEHIFPWKEVSLTHTIK